MSAASRAAVVGRLMATPDRYDLAGTLAPLTVGRADPTAAVSANEFWWASRTPDGPGTLHLCRDGERLRATGYGAGRDWLIEQADAIAGLRDEIDGFAELVAAHPMLHQAWRAHRGLRLTCTRRLFAVLVPTILAQKVTGIEAARGYLHTVRHFAEPAPGPRPGLVLPPDPAALAATPYWVFHPFGIEGRRADTMRRVALVATSLEASPDAATATTRLLAMPGVGAWTAAEAVRVAYGDPDAVTVGDYHLPHQVVYRLTGAARAGSRESRPGELSPADQRMLELLEPFRGQRARVCQVLLASGAGAPRFGPRMPIRSFARF